MAATEQDIKDLTGSSLADATVTPFLDAANCIIENVGTDCTDSLSTTCLDKATAYIGAHLLVTSNVGKGSLQLKREELDGRYTVEYLVSSIKTEGFMSTMFGQTANALLKGCLAELDKRPIKLVSIGSIS